MASARDAAAATLQKVTPDTIGVKKVLDALKARIPAKGFQERVQNLRLILPDALLESLSGNLPRLAQIIHDLQKALFGPGAPWDKHRRKCDDLGEAVTKLRRDPSPADKKWLDDYFAQLMPKGDDAGTPRIKNRPKSDDLSETLTKSRRNSSTVDKKWLNDYFAQQIARVDEKRNVPAASKPVAVINRREERNVVSEQNVQLERAAAPESFESVQRRLRRASTLTLSPMTSHTRRSMEISSTGEIQALANERSLNLMPSTAIGLPQPPMTSPTRRSMEISSTGEIQALANERSLDLMPSTAIGPVELSRSQHHPPIAMPAFDPAGLMLNVLSRYVPCPVCFRHWVEIGLPEIEFRNSIHPPIIITHHGSSDMVLDVDRTLSTDHRAGQWGNLGRLMIWVQLQMFVLLLFFSWLCWLFDAK